MARNMSPRRQQSSFSLTTIPENEREPQDKPHSDKRVDKSDGRRPRLISTLSRERIEAFLKKQPSVKKDKQNTKNKESSKTGQILAEAFDAFKDEVTEKDKAALF